MSAFPVRPRAPGEGTWFRELALEALRNLYAVRRRSYLALVGIAIGTAAVIALLNIGHNARSEALRQFQAMGPDIFVIQRAFDPEAPPRPLSAQEALAVADRLGSVTQTTPLIAMGGRIGQGRTSNSAAIVGALPELAGLGGLRLQEGRFIGAHDGRSTFVVLGSAIAGKMGEGGGPAKPGDLVRLGSYRFTVVGVLEPMVRNALMPADFNNAAFIPLASARRINPTAEINAILGRLTPGTDDLMAASEIAGHFRSLARPLTVRVETARQLVEAMQGQMRVHTLLLGAIGIIALLVGGGGVMNVMLMSVAERKREIGLRRAVGARQSDIRTMFLIETVELSLLGGVLGTLAGLAIAAIVAESSGWRFSLAPLALPLGIGVSAIVGLLAGMYPALQAARLDPVEALRAD